MHAACLGGAARALLQASAVAAASGRRSRRLQRCGLAVAHHDGPLQDSRPRHASRPRLLAGCRTPASAVAAVAHAAGAAGDVGQQGGDGEGGQHGDAGRRQRGRRGAEAVRVVGGDDNAGLAAEVRVAGGGEVAVGGVGEGGDNCRNVVREVAALSEVDVVELRGA